MTNSNHKLGIPNPNHESNLYFWITIQRRITQQNMSFTIVYIKIIQKRKRSIDLYRKRMCQSNSDAFIIWHVLNGDQKQDTVLVKSRMVTARHYNFGLSNSQLVRWSQRYLWYTFEFILNSFLFWNPLLAKSRFNLRFLGYSDSALFCPF